MRGLASLFCRSPSVFYQGPYFLFLFCLSVFHPFLLRHAYTYNSHLASYDQDLQRVLHLGDVSIKTDVLGMKCVGTTDEQMFVRCAYYVHVTCYLVH